MNGGTRMMRRAGNLMSTALAAALALSLGSCLRANVIPKAEAELTVPMSMPRPVDRLDVPKDKDPTKIYRIGPRDVLRVDVRKDPAISQQVGYTVTDEGNILLPYIGPVEVANLTSTEAEKRLNELLAQYIREPDAKVGIQEYRSKYVYVVGQVARPGRQIMRADMLTLQEAIFGAGLTTPDAAIQRTKVITPAEEHPIVRQIDLTDILYKGRMAENMLLQPNDIVYVPAKQSSNLTAAIRDLIRPVDSVVSLGYRASFSGYGNNGNNGDNGGGGGGFFGGGGYGY